MELHGLRVLAFGEDREFLGLVDWVEALEDRPVLVGRAVLGLEFDFAVGEELADAGAFGWREVVATQIQIF